jgi:hypothetical protein
VEVVVVECGEVVLTVPAEEWEVVSKSCRTQRAESVGDDERDAREAWVRFLDLLEDVRVSRSSTKGS